MAEENPEAKERKRIIEVLKTMPEGFKVDGIEKNTVIAEIEAGAGEEFIAIIGGASPSGGNKLGKRYLCVNCKTEVLATKAGEGKIGCCGQPMFVKEPQPIPSSD
ncbi:MAG: hypothetical protein HYT20_02035 [Candidatus Nealsonbacteria bacterium]|nr:hypothetical protein [Candidatus Nealsonbacteria bacterium]